MQTIRITRPWRRNTPIRWNASRLCTIRMATPTGIITSMAASKSSFWDRNPIKWFWELYHILKFRKWFKYGLKAQKLLAQGIALGIIAINKAPCKGKSFVNCLILLKLLPLQGDKLASMITQGAALG